MPRARAPRRLRKPHDRGELRALVDECIVLADRLVWVAEHLHGDEGRGAVRRGIVRGLARYGPQTVPELARARSVTRQNVQPVIDTLLASGHVERLPNPRHARSPRFGVTARGLAMAARMDQNDARALAAVAPGLSTRDLAISARTLRRVRERFEISLRWKAAVRPHSIA